MVPLTIACFNNELAVLSKLFRNVLCQSKLFHPPVLIYFMLTHNKPLTPRRKLFIILIQDNLFIIKLACKEKRNPISRQYLFKEIEQANFY